MQDQISGARASRWGHETAQALAREIGASDMRKTSNECRFKDQRTVIKCAAPATNSVGVTYRMLARLDVIIAAFQQGDATFELWSMTPEQFCLTMRETRSQDAAAGKVGLVSRRVFEQSGRHVGTVRVSQAG